MHPRPMEAICSQGMTPTLRDEQKRQGKPAGEQQNNAAADTAKKNDQRIQNEDDWRAEPSGLVGKQQGDERANAASAAAQNQG